MTTYYGILTRIGEAKQANALALRIPLEITELAVGDGGGNDAPVPTPDREQLALLGEWRKAPLNRLYPDTNNANYLIAEQVLPESVGGRWIRTMGLYDKDGDLIAVCNCPPTYKPLLEEGSGRTQVVRMVIMVASTAAFMLKIDPAVVLATRDYVDESIKNQARATETAFGLVTFATKAETVEATERAKAVTPAGLVGLMPCRGIAVYNTPGTFSFARPSGCDHALVYVTGAGAGGGGSASERAGGGGAGGTAFMRVTFTDETTVAVTVGRGGSGGPLGFSGGNGGTSSFGAFCSATGGVGGGVIKGAPAGGAGGTATGGDLLLAGGAGSDGVPDAFGTGLGIGGGHGGSSFWGGGGRGANGPGMGAICPGAGGGGGGAGTGGRGADGLVMVMW
ncbi:phage tail protein [Bordetella sp. 2513F-2]